MPQSLGMLVRMLEGTRCLPSRQARMRLIGSEDCDDLAVERENSKRRSGCFVQSSARTDKATADALQTEKASQRERWRARKGSDM